MNIQKILKKFLNSYPTSLQNFLKGSVVIIKENRFATGDRVEGSYDVETGEIILWNPEGNDEENLFVILTHEWGHKVYHEWLSNKEKMEWMKVRSKEKIDFSLEKSYSVTQIPEEEYSTIFCLVSKKLYWMKAGMKAQSKKLGQRMKKEFPLAASMVEDHIRKSAKSKKKAKPEGRRNITHKEVETIKAWIRQAVGN